MRLHATEANNLLKKKQKKTDREKERERDRQTDIGFVASMPNYYQGHFKVQKDFN